MSTAEATIRSQPILVNAYRNARVVPIWEQAAVSLWLLVNYVNIPGASAIRYLMVAAFIAYGVQHYKAVVTLTLRCWPLLLLPIYGAFSFIWSDYSGQAMRTGILYLMTPLILIIIASRMELKVILRCFFFAGAITVLYLLPDFPNFEFNQKYTSKNYLASHVTFAMFFAMNTAMSTSEPRWLRMAAAPFIPVCFMIVVLANSATSIVLATVGALGLLLVRFLWISISKLRHLRSIIMLSSLSIGLLAFAAVLTMPTDTFLQDFLALLGKDATFTGRTALWDAGRLISEENPIFGVGLDGFWQYDVGAAQTLNENDHKPFGTKLSFHNTYIEVQVHLGLIGLWLFLLIMGWCLYRTVFAWLKDPSLEHSAMLVITGIILISTFTESWLWIPFCAFANLFYLGAIAELGTSHRKLVGRIPAVLKYS